MQKKSSTIKDDIMIKSTTYDSELIGHELEEINEDSDIQSILDGKNTSIEIVNPEKKFN